ncbi:MAG: HEAT repeat domain-containing protein, partial [Ginsengibacter sp.]
NPIIFISLITVLLLTDMMNYNGKIVLYIFGLSAILVDVLRSAINSPVLLTMMQPLATLQRLRAHNIVKGIMDPFAYFFCGAFLLIVFYRDVYSLEILVIVLLALALAWVIGIFKVHQQYLKTLIKTISSRYFSQEEFSLYDHAARELIENKIKAGTELEVLYILKMLATRRGEESSELIIQALKHPSERVINEALNLTGALHIKESEATLSEIINNHPSLAIRSEAIKVLSKITFQDDVILPLMQSEEKAIRHSAIIAVLNHSKVLQHVAAAEQSIKDLLTSPIDDEKKEAALILCETGNGHFDNELIGLLNEKNESLQLLAVKAIGHHPSHQCLYALINKINDYPKAVADALVTAREKSLPFLKAKMLSDQCFAKQKELLINAIGRIGGKASHEILLGLMKELPGCQPTIIKILHRCHFKSTGANQPDIESLIREYLVAAAIVLHMQKRLLSTSKDNKILFRSLEIELISIRDTLLFLFSFIYNREQISKVKAAMEINKKERNANAIELIDMTVKKEFANPFNAAFEFGDIEHRCALLKNLFPKDIFPGIEEIFSSILIDEKLFYNNWTKACSLYTAKTLSHLIDKSLIHKYQHSDDLLLSEIAGYSVKNN